MKQLTFRILLIIYTVFVVSIPVFADIYYAENVKRNNETSIINEEYNLNDLISFALLSERFRWKAEDAKEAQNIEDMFLDVMHYYSDFVDAQNKNINLNKVFDRSDEEFEKYKDGFYIFGLLMQFDGNNCHFTISNKYINEHFAPYLSKEWQELLGFETRYDKPIKSDGNYVISKSELIKIIAFYKNFCKKYPEFSKKHNIYETIKSYEEDLKHYPYLLKI